MEERGGRGGRGGGNGGEKMDGAILVKRYRNDKFDYVLSMSTTTLAVWVRGSTTPSCVGQRLHHTSCVGQRLHHTSCVGQRLHYTSCVGQRLHYTSCVGQRLHYT